MLQKEGKIRIPAGCAISGIFHKDGTRENGTRIIDSIRTMHDRSNGLGGGFAGYGIYPEYADFYAFHVFYDTQNAKDECEKELERQRARSRFLQVQIQPHFYTNILNLIHGMAQIQDFEEIQKLCRVSAAYFRYLMGQKGTFVPLKEELRCLTSYIEIQHCRYKDMLEIQVNVETEMEDEMILPLVIQTFVGNSVKHNIMLVPHLEIELTVKREGEHDLLILIEDNGLGFKKEILDKINRNESIEEEGEHIGIQNVKERIREFYGEAYELKITSQPGYSEIRILLPRIEKQ